MNDLRWIKKHYGEKMMHLCRSLFPKILEKGNLLPVILEAHFPHNRHLAEDIINQDVVDDFKGLIFSFVNIKETPKVNTSKSAVELMKDAGYTLYPECQTEEDIQSFRKYWNYGEELCTFTSDRLATCRVWFAIKENIDDIKRENFKNPRRQDEYGTSAISIQFTKSKNQTCSIKNRYNHVVDNPDNTFSSNLDNIVVGLSDAFERDYGVKDLSSPESKFELENYVCANNKYYRYNYQSCGVYFCEGNVIVDNDRVIELKPHQMIIDNFVVDFKEKTIKEYVGDGEETFDSFPKTIGKIEKIDFKDGVITASVKDGKDVKIGVDDVGRITSYKNENVKECKDDFLYLNETLKELDMPNLTKCGDDFLYTNQNLEEVNLPKLKKCGILFLANNNVLESLSLPSLEFAGGCFIYSNRTLKHINLQNLKVCGNSFLMYNDDLEELNLPKLYSCGSRFLNFNNSLEYLYAPNLKNCGSSFLARNNSIKEIDLPALIECGNGFFYRNTVVNSINLPRLKQYGGGMLYNYYQSLIR